LSNVLNKSKKLGGILVKSKRILATLLTLSLSAGLLVGCGGKTNEGGGNAAAEMDKEQYLNVVLGAEPKSLDASKASDKYSSEVLIETQEGLTRVVQENGKDVIKPAGATEWSMSPDGLTWTFKLRDYKWSDGKAVTAQDYVYGIQRTVDGKTGSPYAFLLFPIKNAQKINGGKASVEELGVKALDEKTLEIKLESPTAYFLDLTYFKVMQPQRKDIIEAAGERYGSEADTMVFSGPFKITEWVHNNQVVLEKNENYWDKDSVKLNKITMKIIKEETSRMNELYNGSLDIAAVTKQEWIEKFNQTGKFDVLSSYDASTAYTFFNTKDKYFSNAKIRKAFSIAQDRTGAASTLFRGLADPALAWCPPSVQVGGEDFRTKSGEQPIKKLMDENKDPKALLVEGLKELGLDPDPAKHTIKYLESGTSARNKEFAEFYQQNFKSVLGVNVETEYVEWPIFQKRTDEFDYQIASMAWTGDYNDPMTFFDMYMTGAGVVPTGWSSAEYDAAIKEAQTSTDSKVRFEAFKKAEDILIYKDSVISPTVFRKKNTYVAKHVKNVMTPLFGVPEYKNAYTSGRK
jgi:oligopeptide transport system substrate-binding protein